MEYEKDLKTINEGILKFQEETMFIANYLMCNLQTRGKISSLITEKGQITGTIVQVLIDYELKNDELVIGMGQGPHTKKISL
jgi:hypothetical protein